MKKTLDKAKSNGLFHHPACLSRAFEKSRKQERDDSFGLWALAILGNKAIYAQMQPTYELL